jgi:hypothetical protein
MQVVINTQFGGFGLSKEARDLYRKKTSQDAYFIEDLLDDEDDDREVIDYNDKEFRTDYALIEIVEELAEAANGRHAFLSVISIPNDLNDNWEIVEYDGREHVAEKHRKWG